MAKRKDKLLICPVTNQPLVYLGRGRLPVFHASVTQAQRKAYKASLKAEGQG